MTHVQWPITKEIPEHLKPYIVEQEYEKYTAIDQASWRFIMALSKDFLGKHAHQKYKDGLKETGISTDRIPKIGEMDACLQRFGWRAVAVSGFIPPAVFMDFLSLGVLPIACDMRKIENLSYTPAPDIVHEAAGHAPIIADPDYAKFLRLYGEISKNAIYSKADMDVYAAIRHLSEVKEDPKATLAEIDNAQVALATALAAQKEPSEATLIARMNWWTVEYGLIGTLDNPQIYGAGLLSSLYESYHCFDANVKKIPFSIECIHQSYDITQPQPQLYVTKSFSELNTVLEEFSQTMAYRQGGIRSLEKAKKSGTLNTIQLDNGLQISGKLTHYETCRNVESFIKFEGPTQLAYQHHEIEGQSPEYHQHGFSTPLGLLKNGRRITDYSDAECMSLKELTFASGIHLRGNVKKTLRLDGKLLIIQWDDCTITLDEKTLYKPEWGTFDMACGTSVVSVFGGPADYASYDAVVKLDRPSFRKQKSNFLPEKQNLTNLYDEVYQLDKKQTLSPTDQSRLEEILNYLQINEPQDWLLTYEIYRLFLKNRFPSQKTSPVHARLLHFANTDPKVKDLITRGLSSSLQ